MKEILAGSLDSAVEDNELNAIKIFEGNTYLDDKTQVWELSDENYDRLCNFTDENWSDEWGWWRGAEGSNMGGVVKRYNINNHYIKAWDGVSRENFEEENKTTPKEDRWFEDRKYKNLLRYFCDEIGASTERNVCALAVDLARQNNMTMAELFRKYQG